MLDPDLVLQAVVDALSSIPVLSHEMLTDADTPGIGGHQFLYGVDGSLASAISEMPSPSILIAYTELMGGNFDGSSVFKHRLQAYIRPKNAGNNSPVQSSSPPHLWWLAMNEPIFGGPQGIRYTELMEGRLLLVENPSLRYQQDEQLQDLFVGTMTFTEIGDN